MLVQSGISLLIVLAVSDRLNPDKAASVGELLTQLFSVQVLAPSGSHSSIERELAEEEVE